MASMASSAEIGCFFNKVSYHTCSANETEQSSFGFQNLKLLNLSSPATKMVQTEVLLPGLAYFSVIACVMLCFICARKIGTMMISNVWPNLDCSDHRVMSPWNKKHQKSKCKENISKHAMQGVGRLIKHVPDKNTGGDGDGEPI